jgi:thiamine-phosphate pyrophosphorylase
MIEGLRTRAAKLAAAARALQAGGGPGTRAPFSLAFLTDRARAPHPELIARALPAGEALIYRDYDDPARAARGAALQSICAARGVLFLVGSDADLARRLRADGVHLRAEDLRSQPPSLSALGLPPSKTRGGGLLLTAACHAADEIALAAALSADAIFLSPVFATRSHPDVCSLGAAEFRRLAAFSRAPVIALGGVDETNALSLAAPNVGGFAAIGAFAPRQG